MKYFLVKETRVFVDPHGSPDEGGDSKFVWEREDDFNDEEDIDYLLLHKKYTRPYDSEIIEEEDLRSSEDAYNSEYLYYEVKEISKKQYHEYDKIIKAYDSIE